MFRIALCALLFVANLTGAVAEYAGPRRALLSQSVPAWVKAGYPYFFDMKGNRAYLSGLQSTSAAAITVSRASSGYVNNSVGVWTSIGANLPRLSDLGLLVEETRTNLTPNTAWNGAVVGTIGSGGVLPTGVSTPGIGLTYQIIGTGLQQGLPYFDLRMSGTPNSTAGVGFSFGTTASGTIGDTYSVSGYVQRVAGAVTNLSSFSLRIANESGATAYTDMPTPIRMNQTKAITTTTIGVFFRFNCNDTITPLDITFRFYGMQTELGGSVTSPIVTSGSTLLRNADVVTMTTPPTFGSAYTLFTQGTPQAPAAYAVNQGLAYIGDGGSTNRLLLYRASSGASARAANTSAGTTTNIVTPSTFTNTSGKFAAATTAGAQAASFNGDGPTTGAGALPIGANAVQFGVGPGTNPWNGFVEAIGINPTVARTGAQLQADTQ